MIFRMMSENDIDSVYDIESSSVEFPWSLQQWENTLSGNDRAIVGCEDGEVIGYTVFSTVLDESTLLNIAVNLNYQRLGYGRKLLEQGLAELIKENVRNCYLEVRVGNDKAISLYRSLGFVQVGTRKNYYPAINGREDAFVMCRELPMNELGEF